LTPHFPNATPPVYFIFRNGFLLPKIFTRAGTITKRFGRKISKPLMFVSLVKVPLNLQNHSAMQVFLPKLLNAI
jgi:hypothetical protein